MLFKPKKIYTAQESDEIINRITERVRPRLEKYIDAIKKHAASGAAGKSHISNFPIPHRVGGSLEKATAHEVSFLGVQYEIKNALIDEGIAPNVAESKSTRIAYQITQKHDDWLSRILADALEDNTHRHK